MLVTELKSNIMHKQIDNFYIFTGDEIEIMNIYANKIAEVSNKLLSRVDCVSQIFRKLGSFSLIDKSYCYVVRDDKDFMTSDKALESIQSKLKNDILILMITNLDKRSKVYKLYQDRIVEFNHIEPKWFIKYINQKVVLNKDRCLELANACDCDYGQVMLELDKVITYHNACNDKDVDSTFDMLMDSGVLYQSPKDAIFDLVDAVMHRQLRRAFDLLDDCIAIGENPLTIVTVLYNNVKQVLQVQSCKSSNISDATGLPWNIVKVTQSKCGIYTISELVNMLYLIRSIEKSIKIGTIDPTIAVPYILVNI